MSWSNSKGRSLSSSCCAPCSSARSESHGCSAKRAEASQWLERYEAKKQTVSKRLRPLVSPGTTVAVLRIDNGKVWVHAPRFFPSTRCSDFSASGLLVNQARQDERIRRVPIDFGRFADLQVDKLIVIRGRRAAISRMVRRIAAHERLAKP